MSNQGSLSYTKQIKTLQKKQKESIFSLLCTQTGSYFLYCVPKQGNIDIFIGLCTSFFLTHTIISILLLHEYQRYFEQ